MFMDMDGNAVAVGMLEKLSEQDVYFFERISEVSLVQSGL